MSTVSGEKRSMVFIKMTVVYVVPGLVVLAVYAKIIVVVRRHRRAVEPHRHATILHRPNTDQDLSPTQHRPCPFTDPALTTTLHRPSTDQDLSPTQH